MVSTDDVELLFVLWFFLSLSSLFRFGFGFWFGFRFRFRLIIIVIAALDLLELLYPHFRQKSTAFGWLVGLARLRARVFVC